MDRETAEELKLEAEYWKQVLLLLGDSMENLREMNALIPDAVTNPEKLLRVQRLLMKVVEHEGRAIDIIKGRAIYLERYVEGS
jgi:hypothetical protein